MLAVASVPRDLDGPGPWKPRDETVGDAEVRIAQLEAELAETRACYELKDAEVCKAQQALAQLEDAFRGQPAGSQLEQEQRLKDRFEEERIVVRRAEERARESEEKIADLRRKLLRDRLDLEERLAALEELRRKAEQRAAVADEGLASLKGVDSGSPDGAPQPGGGSELEQAVRELRQQLAGERRRRAEAEEMLRARERQLVEVEGRLARRARAAAAAAGGGPEEEAMRLTTEAEGRSREERRKRLEAEGSVSAADLQLEQVQQQLVGELEKRMLVMEQLAAKDSQLEDLQKAVEIDGLSWQSSLEGQVCQKQREVCEMQQQIAEELSRRQALQYKVIEKDRLVCGLQQQLVGRLAPERAAARPTEDVRLSPRVCTRHLHLNKERGWRDESKYVALPLSARGYVPAREEQGAAGVGGAEGGLSARRPLGGGHGPASAVRGAAGQRPGACDGPAEAWSPRRQPPHGGRSQWPEVVPKLRLKSLRADGGSGGQQGSMGEAGAPPASTPIARFNSQPQGTFVIVSPRMPH